MTSAEQRIESLRTVARLLGMFARQVELKRALEAADRVPHLDFWRVTYGGLSDLAVIGWCKLFGASGSNELHWRNVFPDRLDEFRDGLHGATGMDAAGFTAYWREMKHWRDTSFAHFDPDAKVLPKWPHFDTALAAAEHYYGWVVAELGQGSHHLFPSKLAGFRRVVRRAYDEAAALALASTKHLPQPKI